MADPATRARVIDAVALVLGIDAPPGRSLSRDTTPEWDSLRHIEIMLAIEDEFGISLGEDEFAALNSVDAICQRVDPTDAPG